MEKPQIEEPEDRLGMTEEQWAWFQRHTHGYSDQDENGDDICIKKAWESLSPREQEARTERMRILCEEVRQAGRTSRERPVGER